MSLTKISYSMITGASVNVLDCGADKTGGVSSSVAFQTAVNLLPNGGEIVLPSGTYLLDLTGSGVSIGNNITITGVGSASIIKFGAGSSLFATGKSNITIRNVKFKSENHRVYFENCTNVQLLDCLGDGLVTTSNLLTGQGFWFAGCDNVTISNPQFDNYADCIYLDVNGATPCGTTTVTGGVIQHTTHGVNRSFPTGVYAYQAKNTYVNGVMFKNIKPSSNAILGGTGYGVYEGDGTDGNLKIVSVNNCTFIDDDGYTTFPMIGILISVSEKGIVDGCKFFGPFQGVTYGARNQTIQNCFFDGSYVNTTGTGVITGYKNLLFSNNVIQNVDNSPLIIQADGNILESALVIGNTFQNCKYGIWANLVTYPIFIGNKIVDLNTNNSSNDWERGGINFYGPQQGFVDGNTFLNLSTGSMQYGLVSAATSHGIVFTANNYMKGMTVGPMLRPLTAAPTTYIWKVGDSIYNWGITAGGYPGFICTNASDVTTGSVGTGSANLTVVGTGIQNGDVINVAGAGVAGATLTTTVTSGGGTVNIVLTDTASTTVVAAAVTTPGTWKAMAAIAA